MTAAAHAFALPGAVRGSRVDIIDVAPKPISRQDRARRVMLKVAAGFFGVVLVGSGQQIAAHGWRAFVFRAPGVGGSPADEAPERPVAAPALPGPANPAAVPGPPPNGHRAGHREPPSGPPPARASWMNASMPALGGPSATGAVSTVNDFATSHHGGGHAGGHPQPPVIHVPPPGEPGTGATPPPPPQEPPPTPVTSPTDGPSAPPTAEPTSDPEPDEGDGDGDSGAQPPRPLGPPPPGGPRPPGPPHRPPPPGGVH